MALNVRLALIWVSQESRTAIGFERFRFLGCLHFLLPHERLTEPASSGGKAEPPSPVEKKLIIYGLLLGIALLVVLVLISRAFVHA
jgi:hypothetical protein